MRQARVVSLQGERQPGAVRRDKREYMRQRRANPENGARVVAMRQRKNAKRKAAVARHRPESVLVSPEAHGGKADGEIDCDGGGIQALCTRCATRNVRRERRSSNG